MVVPMLTLGHLTISLLRFRQTSLTSRLELFVDHVMTCQYPARLPGERRHQLRRRLVPGAAAGRSPGDSRSALPAIIGTSRHNDWQTAAD